MREIKFRAWDEGREQMFEFDLITYMISNEETQEVICPIKENLMQYTGLKDKNGKEIYEGDIMNCHIFTQELGANLGVTEGGRDFVGLVEWYQNECAFIIMELGGDNYHTFYEVQEPTEELEIIGNIYENPELIGE